MGSDTPRKTMDFNTTCKKTLSTWMRLASKNAQIKVANILNV